ncbi:hypothetical protein ZHAS_00013213 [Anopheles sinensis]|uniref:Uncharacterized protein n=1 Tax=Anopheles sinensis TaxID=74873 RepID=A0A084W581_ANOSI|nr:hypothetical protein ZHAS_00013213 [Anopheles sinensis]
MSEREGKIGSSDRWLMLSRSRSQGWTAQERGTERNQAVAKNVSLFGLQPRATRAGQKPGRGTCLHAKRQMRSTAERVTKSTPKVAEGPAIFLCQPSGSPGTIAEIVINISTAGSPTNIGNGCL